MPGEGKSITSLNLAITMAETGKRVLLMDADMRLPKLGGLLELSSGAGHIPPNPSELLGSAKMSALIGQLKEKYDDVLLDTPPVNVVTDASVTSKWTDGVLFVVRANHSDRSSVSHAVSQMKYANAAILGFVLNGTGTGSAYYSKYRYKKYGYSKVSGYAGSAGISPTNGTER